MLRITRHHDTLSIEGDAVDEIAKKWTARCNLSPLYCNNRLARDGTESFHITVVLKAEMAELLQSTAPDDGEFVLGDTADADVFDLGVGCVVNGDNEAVYVVIFSAWAEALRARLNLPSKDFHITLGFKHADIHDVNKGPTTMTQWNDGLELSHFASRLCSVENSDPLSFTNLMETLFYKIVERPENCSNMQFRTIGKWLIRRNLLVVAADLGHHLLGCGNIFGLKMLLACAIRMKEEFPRCRMDGYLPLSVNTGFKQLSKLRELLQATNRAFLQVVEKHSMMLTFNMQSKVLEMAEMPRNFSWVPMTASDETVTHLPFTKRACETLVAGSAIPTKRSHIGALFGAGITNIITVHEQPLNAELQAEAQSFGIQCHHFHVIDRTPPHIDQVEEMCEILGSTVGRGEGVLVHCQGGVGRTNTVIAAFLIQRDGIGASTAIKIIENERKVIMSESQVDFLKEKWFTRMCQEAGQIGVDGDEDPNAINASFSEKNVMASQCESVNEAPGGMSMKMVASTTVNMFGGVVPSTPDQKTKNTAYVRVAQANDLPPLIMLCGYAASGKTTFARALVNAQPFYFSRINRDEMRGRGECQDALQRALAKASRTSVAKMRKSGQKILHTAVLDNCNLTVGKRKEWLEAAHTVRAWCVFFDTELETCKARITVREGHPTIPPGLGGVSILDSMYRQLVPPTEQEGFEKVLCIRSEEDAAALLSAWGINTALPGYYDAMLAANENLGHTSDSDSGSDVELDRLTKVTTAFEADINQEEDKLLKFPRTSHAMNLGAATRDDRVLSTSDLAPLVGSGRRLIIEEKLDGANLGISISRVTGKINVQNRSHYVSSSYHPQFAPLDRWVAQHIAELWEILEPGRHILYGEWLYALHSVRYTRLPGWFVAYDLFDRQTNQFASRRVLHHVLSKTSIPIVPLVYEGEVMSMEQLRRFVDGPSQFNDERREGVVVRFCNNLSVVSRCKLVRADFIAGNARWEQQKEFNQLDQNFHVK